MNDRMSYLILQRDDAQSQLDALCGECPEVASELEDKIAAFDRLIEDAI